MPIALSLRPTSNNSLELPWILRKENEMLNTSMKLWRYFNNVRQLLLKIKSCIYILYLITNFYVLFTTRLLYPAWFMFVFYKIQNKFLTPFPKFEIIYLIQSSVQVCYDCFTHWNYSVIHRWGGNKFCQAQPKLRLAE